MQAASRVNELLSRRPEHISDQDLSFLEHVLEHYPYFQAARFKYAECLFYNDNLSFNKELPLLAVQTFNRKVLFDSFYEKETTTTQHQIPGLQVELSNFSIEGTIESSASESILVDPPALDFVEQQPSFDLEREYPTKPAQSIKSNRSLELIDSFLKNQKDTVSKIRKAENAPAPVNQDKSTQVPEDLVSETLAKIYIKQNKIEEAIRIYERLSLLEPEKKQKFARLIEEQKKKLE